MDTSKTQNPFEEVCLFMADPSQALAAGQLAKSYGFSIYIFAKISKVMEHLAKHPLTAGVFYQSGDDLLAIRLRQEYKGPILELPVGKEEMLEVMGRELRQLYRNQLKIQDASIQRILRNLNSFVNGKVSLLFVTGSQKALSVALDYINLFAHRKGFNSGQVTDPDQVPSDGWLYTRDLFSLSPENQQLWALKFSESTIPHLILENTTLDMLDQKYEEGLLNEFLYEQLSLQARDITTLEKYTFEELCVQPPESSEPRMVVDHDQTELPPATSDRGTANLPKRNRGGLLSSWWK